MTKVNLGEFKTDRPLRLDPAPNGGWTVSQPNPGIGELSTMIGAFSSAQDMLEALTLALMPELAKGTGEPELDDHYDEWEASSLGNCGQRLFGPNLYFVNRVSGTDQEPFGAGVVRFDRAGEVNQEEVGWFSSEEQAKFACASHYKEESQKK